LLKPQTSLWNGKQI